MEKQSKEHQVQLLAFGPHPDDVELNVGGIIALHARKGGVIVVDLTEGEMSSNGTVESRRQESREAAAVLGVQQRVNLHLPDGGINPYDPEQQRRVVTVIRRYRPDVVLLPYWEDRHPDHVATSQLIDIALFKSGLKMYETEGLDPFRPARWFYYLQHHVANPDLVVDISEVFEHKLQGIQAYKSQFDSHESFQTVINQPVFLNKIRARDQYFGAMIGGEYGEGLIVKGPLAVQDLTQF